MAKGEEVEKAPGITIEMAMKVIGTLATLLLGVVTWVLQTTIEDHNQLQRDFDLFKANIEPRVEQNEGELDNVWEFYNKNEEDEKADIKENGSFYLDIMGKVLVLESDVERLKQDMTNEKN